MQTKYVIGLLALIILLVAGTLFSQLDYQGRNFAIAAITTTPKDSEANASPAATQVDSRPQHEKPTSRPRILQTPMPFITPAGTPLAADEKSIRKFVLDLPANFGSLKVVQPKMDALSSDLPVMLESPVATRILQIAWLDSDYAAYVNFQAIAKNMGQKTPTEQNMVIDVKGQNVIGLIRYRNLVAFVLSDSDPDNNIQSKETLTEQQVREILLAVEAIAKKQAS